MLGTDMESLKSLVANLASWMPAQPRRPVSLREDPMDRLDSLPHLLSRLTDLLHDFLQLPNAQVTAPPASANAQQCPTLGPSTVKGSLEDPRA